MAVLVTPPSQEKELLIHVTGLALFPSPASQVPLNARCYQRTDNTCKNVVQAVPQDLKNNSHTLTSLHWYERTGGNMRLLSHTNRQADTDIGLIPCKASITQSPQPFQPQQNAPKRLYACFGASYVEF